MQALLVVDAQNEFSSAGMRPVDNHTSALEVIRRLVKVARGGGRPVAWTRHFCDSSSATAFIPSTWGSELSPGLGPHRGHARERLFEKDVAGAFTGTALDRWLRSMGVSEVLLVGFYTHVSLSTSAREALGHGYHVLLHPHATGARSLEDRDLGHLSADEVRRTALLQLVDMGATLATATVEPPRQTCRCP